MGTKPKDWQAGMEIGMKLKTEWKDMEMGSKGCKMDRKPKDWLEGREDGQERLNDGYKAHKDRQDGLAKRLKDGEEEARRLAGGAERRLGEAGS